MSVLSAALGVMVLNLLVWAGVYVLEGSVSPVTNNREECRAADACIAVCVLDLALVMSFLMLLSVSA